MMLKVIDCSKRYGSKTILENVTFSVNRNEKVALVGKNGVGKTTLLHLIVGIASPSSGKILFKDQDLFQFPKLRRHIGFAAAEPVFYEKLTTFENLELIGSLYGVKDQSAFLEIAAKTNIHYFLKEPVANLSTGMKKKLQLAAALIHQPDLLILDEPFNGLDTESVELFKHIIASYPRIVIFTSHNFDFVFDLSEKIFYLENSKTIRQLNTVEAKNNRRILGNLIEREIFYESKKK
jgi:ABC-type multidrug transport system ATPase subunit